MRAAGLVLLAVTLAALVAPPAAAQQFWQDQQITSGFKQWRGGAQVWDQTVYYGEMGSNGVSSVYVWTQGQSSRRLLGGDGISRAPSAVWGGNLVVSHIENGEKKLYLYDAGGTEIPVATSAGNKWNSDIYNSTIVWEDDRAASSQIYIWDPVNGERILSPSNSNQVRPQIWGDRIVWYQYDNPSYPPTYSDGIYMWTPEAGTNRVGWGLYGAVYQDRVVTWTNAYWEYPGPGPGIYHPGFLNEWTPETGFHTILQHDESTSHLETWGDLIVYTAGAWDPAHGFSHYIEPGHYVSSLSLYADEVAWPSSSYQIHLSTMVPEPSSLLSLLCGLAAVAIAVRRSSRGEVQR